MGGIGGGDMAINVLNDSQMAKKQWVLKSKRKKKREKVKIENRKKNKKKKNRKKIKIEERIVNRKKKKRKLKKQKTKNTKNK